MEDFGFRLGRDGKERSNIRERGIASILNLGKERENRKLYKPIYDANDFRRRPDGSLVLGLTLSEWESYVQKYSNVHPKKLVHLRDTLNTPSFDRWLFEDLASDLHNQKAKENRYGKPALVATSLYMLLSVQAEPTSERKPFSVHGEITTFPKKKGRYIYKSDVGSDSDGGNLILNGPPEQSLAYDVSVLHQSRKLSITLYDDEQGQHLYPLDDDDDPVILDHSPNEFEHVTHKEVKNAEISLTLRYMSIPMGICGRVELFIFNKYFKEGKDTDFPQKIKVCGKVVATYKNTFGNYNGEEIVLFDKKLEHGQYATVTVNKAQNLLAFGRSWVAAPVFSLLHLRIHLFNFETKKSIVEQEVELATQDYYGFSEDLIADEFLISATAAWSTIPAPLQLFEDDDGDDDDDGDGDDDGNEDDDDDDGNEDDGDDDDTISTKYYEPAIEVFSLLICHKTESKESQIHGRLQFSPCAAVNFEDEGTDIFNKEEADPLSLFGRSNTIVPMLEGSALFEENRSYSFICDLKDTLSRLSIKGSQYCNVPDYFEKRNFRGEIRMCSIFQDDHGFAALHYSIFSPVMKADLMVTYKQTESAGVNPSTVSGSLCARYAGRNYSSQYEKDCYRIVLFKDKEVALVQKEDCVLIPLSRSSFLVPSYSSAVFDVNLMFDTHMFSCKTKVQIGKQTKIIPGNKGDVKFVLKWSELI